MERGKDPVLNICVFTKEGMWAALEKRLCIFQVEGRSRGISGCGREGTKPRHGLDMVTPSTPLIQETIFCCCCVYLSIISSDTSLKNIVKAYREMKIYEMNNASPLIRGPMKDICPQNSQIRKWQVTRGVWTGKATDLNSSPWVLALSPVSWASKRGKKLTFVEHLLYSRFYTSCFV